MWNTKTSPRLLVDIKMPSLPPWETSNYYSPITKHPGKQKIKSLSKCRHENKNLLAHFDPYTLPIPTSTIHHIYITFITKDPLHPFRNNPTTHPTHRKYHFPPLNLYTHLQAPLSPADIILAMFSWLLEIRFLHIIIIIIIISRW